MKRTLDNVDTIINFEEARLKLAAKEPPQGGNWLSRLPFETRFLASRKNNSDSTLSDFLIASDPTKMPFVYLGYELNHPSGGFRFVDPIRFSRDYELFCTIDNKEQENGNSTAVETGGVEGDGKPSIVHSLHEEE